MGEHSVVTLQSAYRGSKDREKYEVIVGEKRQRDFAVRALQSAWRGQHDRKLASERKHKVVGAAKKIQKKIHLPTEFEGGTGVAGKPSRGARQAQPRSASAVPGRVRDDVAVFLQRHPGPSAPPEAHEAAQKKGEKSSEHRETHAATSARVLQARFQWGPVSQQVKFEGG